jgi:hypothetical protein
VEYFIVVGFATFIVITLIALAFFYTDAVKDRMILTQVDSFASKVISSAESVYYAGEPSRLLLKLNLPEQVQNEVNP